MAAKRPSCFGNEFRDRFFAGRRELLHLTELFDHVPASCFFAKDRQSRFVRMNSRNRELYGIDDEADILGRSDRDFHPPALAEAYIAEDERVMTTGKAVKDQTWLVPYLDGRLQWFVCTKIPLLDHADTVVGVAGVMYPISAPEEERSRFQELAPAVRYLEENFHKAEHLSDIAELCGLSQTHFNRRFKRMFRMSPSQYRTALRVEQAKALLRTTSRSALEIALECGFFDQSHLAKHFGKATGMAPAQYRNRFRPAD